MNPRLINLFASAWSARLDQKIEDVLLLTSQIREALHEAPASDQDRIQLRLLEVSLLRARGQIIEAKEKIAVLEKEFLAAGALYPSRFLMEKGLNCYFEQDFSQALENFLVLVSRFGKEPDVVLLAQAHLNALLCCEVLGLPSQNLSQKFQTFLSSAHVLAHEGLILEWRGFEARSRWREGDLSGLDQISVRGWDPITYLLFFLKTLPFFPGEFRADLKLEDYLTGNTNLYLKSYHLRTLTGHSHPDDLTVNRFGALVERFYAWTWMWLNTDHFPLEKVTALLEKIDERIRTQTLSRHGQEITWLGIRWLKLLRPGALRPFADLVDRFEKQVHTFESPIFELEGMMQSVLRHRIQGDELQVREGEIFLQAHPLWVQFGPTLGSLLGGEVMPALSPLHRKIAQRKEMKLRQERSHLFVDLDLMQAHRRDTGQTIASESFCRALALLKTKAAVPSAEFLAEVFRQKGYESFLHDARIANLLTRLRDWLPEDEGVQKRGDWIRRQGSWDRLNILGENLPDAAYMSITNSSADLTRAMPALSSFVPQELVGDEDLRSRPFSRKEIEMKTGKSRATVNRLLEKWTQDGFITAEGQGPARRYSLNPHWRAL